MIACQMSSLKARNTELQASLDQELEAHERLQAYCQVRTGFAAAGGLTGIPGSGNREGEHSLTEQQAQR